MSKHSSASVMFRICSFSLSISHLKLFGSWQFIRFSSTGQGWAIIRPHQAWRGNHSWAFFSHGVFSQWQAHWLCVGSGCVCLPSFTVELLRGTQIETEVETDAESHKHQDHSSVTVTKQCIIPAHYTISQHHTERYTGGLSYCIVCKAVCHQDPQMAHSYYKHRGLSLACQRYTLLYSSSLLHYRLVQSCRWLKRCIGPL